MYEHVTSSVAQSEQIMSRGDFILSITELLAGLRAFSRVLCRDSYKLQHSSMLSRCTLRLRNQTHLTRISAVSPPNIRTTLFATSWKTSTISCAPRARWQSSLAISEPHAYTGGAWLHQNTVQQCARTIDFDFDALSEEVMRVCPAATSITSIVKKEGGFNRVFIFTLDTGDRIVARVPTRIAGPRRLTTHSEVATIKFLHQHTSIAVPHIITWSDTESNPVGSEYIIMKAVEGVPLTEKWSSMAAGDQITLIRSVGALMKQLGALDFPGFGSLYFRDTPLAADATIALKDGFVLGPHVGSTFWDCSISTTKHFHYRAQDHGPWETLEEYLVAHINSGYSDLPQDNSSDEDRLPYLGSVQENLKLLRICEDINQSLLAAGTLRFASAPMLWHPDLHMRNIFVSPSDPTSIRGIIDWQSAAVEPAFMFAVAEPDFAERPDEAAGQADSQSSNTASSMATRNAQRRNKAYHLLASITPKLSDAMKLDSSILRVLNFCNMGWRNGAAMLRDELGDLSSKWAELELPGKCPYQPDEQEQMLQKELYEDFTVAQELKSSLARSFYGDPSGWVPASEWEAAQEKHRRLFRDWLETATKGDGAMTKEKATKLWPWDPA